MKNEAITVEVPPLLYLDLGAYLRQTGDTRTPGELVATALKSWLNPRLQKERIGYQWKNLFLPDGTELRMRYRGVFYYASIKRDQLVYGGEVVSPRGWTLMVTGTVRNPWRDIWIRRTYTSSGLKRKSGDPCMALSKRIQRRIGDSGRAVAATERRPPRRHAALACRRG